MTKPAILVEGVVLFLALPLAFRFAPVRLPPLPILWFATAYAVFSLRHDSVSGSSPWNLHLPPGGLLSILTLFALLGSAIVLGVRRFEPGLFLNFVRTRPGVWAAVMVLYPILSVYPQGIVYRLFFLHRFAELTAGSRLPSAALNLLAVVASAAAFSLMHIVFRNQLAVGMTFFGGLLFAWRFQSTGSLALSSVEHALYGCLLFTVGLGQYFYLGSARLLN